MCKDIDTKEVFTFVRGDGFEKFSHECSLIAGANIIKFDLPALRRHFPNGALEDSKAIDLQVVSRLIWFQRPGGHSVENFAKQFNMVKPPIKIYDDPTMLDEYVHRCTEDVEITYKMWELFQRFIYDKDWAKSLRAEHELEVICRDMTNNGFFFKAHEAKKLLKKVEEHKETLTNEIVADIGDVVDEEIERTLKRNKDGKPNHHALRWLGGVDDGFKHGEKRVFTTYRPFNPGSVKDRITVLNEAGWEPVEKTKTHMDAERELATARRKKDWAEVKKQEERLAKLRVTGWKVNETNLETLPDDAPEGVRKLAEWLTLEGRRADLQEWLDAYNERTGRIHGKFWHIGSWTHRMSHSDPNQANIFSITKLPEGKTLKDVSPVKRIKIMYDKQARALWAAEPDSLLIGTDAEGIQLRVLAHYMGDEAYSDAVANGKKENETDVHNVNKRALGLNHIVRDDAKTFIYAWLLGAGIPKVASILRCSTSLAKQATVNFLESLPALKQVKQVIIPRDAKQGYFVGLDGRKVVCSNEHLMLAGYLQNGEKIIMQHANILWRKWLDEREIVYRQVDFVHDEWQTEVPVHQPNYQQNILRRSGCKKNYVTTDVHEIVAELQREAIRVVGEQLQVRCPLAGSSDVGFNWAETH